MAIIRELEIEYGVTQNLGDYSNCKPLVRIKAELGDGDDPHTELSKLAELARREVHAIVDDELEAADREVKYHTGLLYQIRESKVRKAVILVPVGVTLPGDSNWKERDYWYKHGHPYDMREALALRRLEAVKRDKTSSDGGAPPEGEQSFVFLDCRSGDLSKLPPLPDAGPEPVWHQKGLESVFNNLGIDEVQWEELAKLEHVNLEYVRKVLNEIPYNRRSEAAEFIRENRPFESLRPSRPDPEDEDGDDDYDEDDDDSEF